MKNKKGSWEVNRIITDKNSNLYIDIAIWITVSFVLVLGAEILLRNSLKDGVLFLIERFSVFIVNYLIILSITSIAFLFRKTRTIYALISSIVALFYLSGIVIDKFRGTPLIWADIYSFKDGLSMAKNYLNFKTVLIIVSTIALFTFIIVMLWKNEKGDKTKKNTVIRGGIILIISIALLTITISFNNKAGNFVIYLWDLPSTYSENGFIYSFLYTANGFTVEEPSGYSEESIAKIGNELENTEETISTFSTQKVDSKENLPNIIMIQLESFFDPYELDEVKFSTDPIPNFRELFNNSTHGYINVPTYGGGTVRSEFEVLTGLSTDYLPVGEIPNNNILKKQPVESIAYILKERDYNTTVVHNYIGNFYDRDAVFPNLGFEEYVSKEYMLEVTGDGYYPEDIINLKYILELLERDNPQLIYNITVESHGPYNKQYEKENYTVSGNITEEERNELQEYVDKLVGVDKFIGELIKAINLSKEPTIVLAFSDHLPQLNLISKEGSLISNENKYSAPYFMWNNIDLVKNEKNMEAYELTTFILDQLGMVDGVIPTFHNYYKNKDEYVEVFRNIQYDILFGDKYIYSKENPYKKTSLKMGLNNIIVDKAYIEDNKLVVKGTGFTSFSKIYNENKKLNTIFIDENTLICEDTLKNIDKIKVSQVGMYEKVLSTSSTVIVKK